MPDINSTPALSTPISSDMQVSTKLRSRRVSEGRQKETGAPRSPGTRGTPMEAMVTGTVWTVLENGGIVVGAQTGGGRKVAITDQTMTEAEHHLATEVRSEAGKGIDTGRADGLCLVKGNTEKTPKRPRSHSSSRDRKRPRLEEERERERERERRPESHGSSREKNYTSVKNKEPEENQVERAEDDREEEELLKPVWIRCTHAENYYLNDPMDQVGDSTIVGTSKLLDVYDRFEEELVKRQERAKASRPQWEPPKTKLDDDLDESSSDSECESDGGISCSSSSSDSDVFDVIAELKRKKAHPDRLQEELWYNDRGQHVKACRLMTNNAGRLYHYRITVSPPTNFLTDRPTVIEYDDHEYIFEGFSLFSHTPLTNGLKVRVILAFVKNFILCLVLLDFFLVSKYADGGKEVLSMHQVLLYMLHSNKPLVPEEEIANMLQWEELEWQKYAEECKGMIVTSPGMPLIGGYKDPGGVAHNMPLREPTQGQMCSQ
ncbi:UNVERIFIED_CONTAM: hypothetical protein FKN15_011567 [Acipenser sinensis]